MLRAFAITTASFVVATSCAAGPTPEQQVARLREELNASRRAQEDLRGRIERLEARVDAKVALTTAPVAPVAPPDADAIPVLPVVRLQASPSSRTGPRAPDIDTSIPVREPSAHEPVVYEHTVTESEEPVDLNAVVARQSASGAKAKWSASHDDENVDDEFKEALMKYSTQQYDQSASAFRTFANRHPRHSAAAEALYLGGMSYVDAHRCPEALPLFETVIREHPGTDVAGRALLAQGKCEANIGHDDNARNLFNRVVSEHPTSDEATQAKSALAALSGSHAP